MIEFLTALLQSIGKEVVIGIITAAFVASLAFGRKKIKAAKQKKLEAEQQRLIQHKRDIMNGLQSYVVATEDLRELCHKTGAIRAIIVQIHNGGHKPELGKQLKATIVAEWASDEVELIARDWQGALVGSDYILSVIKPMLMHEIFYLKTEDMRAGSMLKDYYTSSGIVGAKIVLLGVSEDTESTFLLACHFKDNHPNIDETFRTEYRERTRAARAKLNLV